MATIWLWAGFNLFVLAMLALDLGVFHRHAHAVSTREATAWSVAWIALAILFAGGIYYFLGRQAGLEFVTGYLIEKALSIDNIFVFVLVFSYFSVPAEHQHRILFWGVLGAIIMRGAMIATGAYLIAQFHWVLYVFGFLLVATGIRMARQKEHTVRPEANPVIRLVRSAIPVVNSYEGKNFFVRERTGDGTRLAATPLFVVLVLIETTDLIFAIDSIPAIFAVTQNTFLVYTSNVFAILGLRSLYFLLAGVVTRFHYLKVGLALVLIFVGAKMLLMDLYKVPIGVSLGVVGAVIAGSVLLSLVYPKRQAGPSQ